MYWKFPRMLRQTVSQNLIGCQLQAYWMTLENNEKETLNISMPYCDHSNALQVLSVIECDL